MEQANGLCCFEDQLLKINLQLNALFVYLHMLNIALCCFSMYGTLKLIQKFDYNFVTVNMTNVMGWSRGYYLFIMYEVMTQWSHV